MIVYISLPYFSVLLSFSMDPSLFFFYRLEINKSLYIYQQSERGGIDGWGIGPKTVQLDVPFDFFSLSKYLSSLFFWVGFFYRRTMTNCWTRPHNLSGRESVFSEMRIVNGQALFVVLTEPIDLLLAMSTHSFLRFDIVSIRFAFLFCTNTNCKSVRECRRRGINAIFKNRAGHVTKYVNVIISK